MKLVACLQQPDRKPRFLPGRRILTVIYLGQTILKIGPLTGSYFVSTQQNNSVYQALNRQKIDPIIFGFCDGIVIFVHANRYYFDQKRK